MRAGRRAGSGGLGRSGYLRALGPRGGTLLDFLAFAAILLLLTVAVPFCLFKVLGWGFARRPLVTLLVAFLTMLLLVGSFHRFFPGCMATGWGRSAIRCTS